MVRERVRIAAEDRYLSALTKRHLRVLLAIAQKLTPEFIRSRVRGWYLNKFYFRVFPEDRPVDLPPAAPANTPAEEVLDKVSVHSSYEPLVRLKARLQRGLPLTYGAGCMAAPPLVSVVLPVYNGEKYIAASIDSVLKQSYRNFELIVVDDGSADGTPEILKRYLTEQRVRIVRQNNQKLPAALSRGCRQARGELLTWTSADNLLKPECLETLAGFLIDRPDVEMVYANEEIIDHDGNLLTGSDFRPGYQVPPGSANIHWPQDPGELIFIQNNYVGACFMYRGWVGRVLGDYAHYCFGYEDYEYWMRMDALFRIAHLGKPDVLYSYRLHQESLTARERELRITDRVRDFMPVEAARHRLYLDRCDITLQGRHPWFSRLEGLFRENGQKVLVQTQYHRITRSAEKSFSLLPVDRWLKSGGQDRSGNFEAAGGSLIFAIVDEYATLASREFQQRRFDWYLSGNPAVCDEWRKQGRQNYLEVQSPETAAYPVLAIVNNLCGLRLLEASAVSGDTVEEIE